MTEKQWWPPVDSTDVHMPCPSCKRQVEAKIETNGNGIWKCKCGDYGKCGFQ